ncbi:MAG: hypothetical protein JWO30_1809 [Fibrobacteres bacterium]|nr:hypothetical protein [Fibrobacterota bacterium]
MSLAGGKKLGLFVLFVLLGLQSALAQNVTYRIHFYSPWKDNAVRSTPPAHINMEGSGGPIANHGPAMTAEGADWYVQSVTFNPGPPGTGDGYRNFSFHNYVPNANDNWANDTTYRNNGKDFTLDDIFFKTGFKNDVWVIPQGPNLPPIITDIPPNTKVVYLFNPWALGAPDIKTGKVDWSHMRFPMDKSRCGWFVFYITDGNYSVTFRNQIGGELYGAAGAKDGGMIDLSSYFSTDDKDTAFIVPTPYPVGAPKITNAYPIGVLGTCKFDLAVTVRDFTAAHPDFEEDRSTYDGLRKGLVLPTLGADKKPKKNTATVSKFTNYLDNWFITDSTNANPALRNWQSCYDLPISKSIDGYWQYSSLDEFTTGFFPLGDPKTGHSSADPAHTNCYTTDIDVKSCMGAPADKPTAVANQNFNFCMEMHANFKYEKGQKFTFIGDDDVWVFINNKLVIDLGGTHWPIKDSVALDTVTGITAGQKYDFDLFYCERQFSGSNLLIKTSIYFEQTQAIKADPTVVGSRTDYNITESTCGDKSCGAVLTASDTCHTIPGVSTFKLTGGSIVTPEALPVGTSHGGIVVDANRTKVSVDTSKIADLPPGIYRIIFTSDRSNRAGYVEFEITGSWLVDFVTKAGADALVGTPVGATLRATLNGKPDLAGQDFTLTPVAGLNVFEDSAMTKPVTSTTVLKTDASGNKKVWVTAAAKGTYTVTVKGVKAKATDTFTANFFAIVKASTPVATPPGTTFNAATIVSLASATPGGATILYTTDGSTPDSALGGTTKTYTGPITLDKTLTLKAIAIKAGYYKSDVMSESYVFVMLTAAVPVATPPGKNFAAPFSVTLASATSGATILYTTDGSVPDSALGGTTKTMTGPIPLTASMTLKAIAIKAGLHKSEVMTETYVYTPPANVKHAYYKDLNGDGKIETVIVDYDEDLSVVPEKLTFKVGAPTDQELTARNDQKEIAFAAGSKSRIVVTFSKPFPFGVTSVADPANSGHQYVQDNIPTLDGAFPVDDSVPPVIISAVVKAPDSLQPYVKVLVTFSETVTLPLGSQTAIVFRRDGTEMASADVKLMGIAAAGDRAYEVRVDSTSSKFPIVGDYAAANTNGEIVDGNRNAPAVKAFMILTGTVPKGKAANVYITFANGTNKAGDGMPTGSEPNTPSDVLFIPFDKAGTALTGDKSDGKCTGCFVGGEGKFVGPVVFMEVPGPVEYDFRIFSNMGEFVAAGKGKITEEDIPGLTPIHNGTGYLARVVWTGRTADGAKAGTGAYVLISTVRTQKNLKTGAPPATDTNRIRFGMLRNYRGS